MNDRSPVNLAARYLLYDFSPALQLRLLYRFYHHRKLDLQDPQTLDEKIEARKTLSMPKKDDAPKRVSVEIGGHNYLLGSTDNMSEARIRRIANTVNSILGDAKDSNPGLMPNKITTLALLDACDKLITLQDENSNMKTELMYLQQKLSLEEKAHVSEPTPMEQLASEIEEKTEGKKST